MLYKMTPSAEIKTTLTVKVTFTNFTLQYRFTPRQRRQKIVLITHKYRGCIAVLSINKSVEPNEEQKVLTSGFHPGITVNTSNRFSVVFGNNGIIKYEEIKGGNNNCSKWPNPLCSKGQAV